MYYYVERSEEDENEAFGWYLKAEKQGNEEAQIAL